MSLTGNPELGGQNLTGASRLPLLRGITPFFKIPQFNNPLDLRERIVQQQEKALGLPVKRVGSGQEMAGIIATLLAQGYTVELSKPTALDRALEHVERSKAKARRLIIDEDTMPWLNQPGPASQDELKAQTVSSRSMKGTALAVGGAVAATMAVGQVLPADFQTSQKAYSELLQSINARLAGSSAEAAVPQDECTDHQFGPCMTEEELRAANIKITARDYVEDASGNTIKQRVILDNNIYYEAVRDPNTGTYPPKFVPISQLPGNVTSLISSSDGNTLFAGGLSDPMYQKTKMYASFDAGRHWQEVAVPSDLSGIPSDLVRFTDRDFFGTTIESEGVVNQFMAKVDPINKTATIQATNIPTITPVNMSVGALQNLDMIALDTNNHTATVVSNRYLQYGLAVSTINYDTNIGSARIITQTLLTDGTLINLGYLSGTGVYTDTNGKLRVTASNFIRNTLYDFDINNPLDGTATEFYYANQCDGKGLMNYGNGTLSITGVDVLVDTQGNKKTRFAGGRSSTLDGSSRAIFGSIEDGVCLDIEPYKRSGMGRQQDMLRMKMNNQEGYELRFGIEGTSSVKAFVDGNYNIYYTDGGLGAPLILPTPTPIVTPTYRLYLPVVIQNHQ